MLTRDHLRHLTLLLTLTVVFGCGPSAETTPRVGEVVKGGDDRTGEYDAVDNWWKPAPDHGDVWGWGQVSGIAVDNPNRIIVGVWGDRDALNRERDGSSNYLVAVDRDGNITENWSQWDSLFNKPHQIYISPYDPERHIWVVERGLGMRDVNMQILKFTNDGSELVMQLVDPEHPRTRAEARANPNPGPYTYGDPSVMAFFPNGDFLLGDGYWNSRIIRYNARGEFLHEFGELGNGPGQFDLIHGLAIDRSHRIYVGDRSNDRIQVFTENGEFIEEWPDVSDPVGVFIDENESVWVVSARLNRIIKFNKEGELQYHLGAFGGTRGGFSGGLSRPHQMDVDQEGNLYIVSWDGGWMDKFVPKTDANPERLVGRPLILEH
ncbi:MAG TPA: hypothetical protein DHW11_00690 [Gemmatimonadetes bacterium]|nr:hypothetical protein [Gemmatimonadota bacterium]HCW79398.1 hypothetical protein [Gemmatimonadota bacterium]